MTAQTDGERLVALETKVDSILEVVEKTNTKIDGLSSSLTTYVTKGELDKAIIERNEQIGALKLSIIDVARKHTLTVWLTGTFSAAAGVLLTILIQRAFI